MGFQEYCLWSSIQEPAFQDADRKNVAQMLDCESWRKLHPALTTGICALLKATQKLGSFTIKDRTVFFFMLCVYVCLQ
jgi:hypothetical protein